MSKAKNSISGAGELLLYGEIGDWWDDLDAKSVVDQLEQLNKDQITIRIHSAGGYVLEGLAIYNRLKESKARKVVHIDGLAASMASVIAMAGDKIIMPENAWMMIHKPHNIVMGNADELRKHADTLDGFEGSLISIYAAKTGKDSHAIAEMLREETWLSAKDALDLGFIDEISTPVKAAASIDLTKFSKVPSDVARAMSAVSIAVSSASTPVKEDKDMPMHDVKDAVTSNDAAPVTGGPDLEAKAQAAIAAERQRVAEITNLSDKYDLPKAVMAELISTGASIQQAKDKVLEVLEQRDAQAKVGRGAIVESNLTGARDAIVNAIEHRVDPGSVKLRDDARAFRVMDMIELARASLQMAGIGTQFMNKAEIAAKAMHSTSDFPLILADVMNKRLRAAYQAAPRTFQAFSRRSDVSDFKTVQTMALSGAPDLEEIKESGEYTYGSMSEEGQSYKLKTFGKIISITRQALINDDLSAFTRIAPAFGASAAEKESDIVYGLMTSNVKLSDNVVLFHSTHKNLGTTGAISETTLSEARKMLRKQSGVGDSRPLNLQAEYLIVPAALETTAQKLLSAVLAAQTSNVNPFANSLNLIVEPRLDAASETAWYLAASPSRIDTIEYGYLSGNEGVYTEIENGFDVDGVKIKARLDFAAGVVDFRGLFKNAGA